MRAATVLPQNYRVERTITLSNNTALMLGLSLAGIVLCAVSGFSFLLAAFRLSPFFLQGSNIIAISTWWQLLAILSVVVGGTLLTLIIHEAVHGLFFWLFTKNRPNYGFKGIYAYASAPDYYIPRNQFIIIGLAPLMCISLIGLALLPFVPLAVVWTLVFILTINATGAVGDLYIVGVLLTSPPSTLIRDFGDGMTFYRPS